MLPPGNSDRRPRLPGPFSDARTVAAVRTEPAEDAQPAWDRRFAAQLFNLAWDYMERPRRTDDEDDAMLGAAFASRWHWSQVGAARNVAVGDWQVAHVASLLGYASVALHFAEHCLDQTLAHEWGGPQLASAHEGMARAWAAAGDHEMRDHHLGLATATLETIEDVEDRAEIERQLATVPS